MTVAAAAQSEAQAPGQAEEQQVQGGQAAGGVDAPGGAAPGEAQPEKKPRQRKEKLPGVVSRDDGDDIFPDLGFKSNKGPKRISRDEAEKELTTELRQEMGLEVPEAYVKPGEEQKEPKPDDKAPQKIKFNGKEYDSMQAIEQEHKSLQGMFKSFDARVKNAEQMAEKAVESARSWRQRAMELEGTAPQPQQQPQQRPQPTDEQSAEQELTAVLKNIDGDRFESLAREHGLPIAGRYLAAQVLATVHDQMLPKLAEQIMAQMQEQFAPYTQSVEFQQQTNTVGTLIENVSQLRNPDGNIAFPELNDPNEMMEVAELWASSGKAEPTPQSLIQAIALYRLYRGARGGQTTNQPVVNVTPPPTTVQRPQSLPAGGAGVTPATPRAGAASDDTRFSRALDEARLVDPVLGFQRRRR